MKSKFFSISGSFFRRIFSINKLQITALASVLILSLVWYSCSKDIPLAAEKSTTLGSIEQQTTLEFIEKAKQLKKDGNIGLRTETYYNVAQAIDQLNDALNLNYCRPDSQYSSMETFKDSSNLIVDGRTNISETDLLTMFNSVAMIAGNHFYAIGDTTASTFAFDVKQANNLVGSALPIHIYFFVSKGLPASTPHYPYGSDEDWKWGYNDGKCIDPIELFDAADILRVDLRKNKIYKNKYHKYYLKDRHTICFTPFGYLCGGYDFIYKYEADQNIIGSAVINTIDVTTNDNLQDQLIFRNSTLYSNYHTCISDSEMNYYYWRMAGLLTNYSPSDKVVGGIEVGYNQLDAANTNIFHFMQVDYWTCVIIGPDPGPPKVNLPCPEPPC